jgi:hypothetical protein
MPLYQMVMVPFLRRVALCRVLNRRRFLVGHAAGELYHAATRNDVEPEEGLTGDDVQHGLCLSRTPDFHQTDYGQDYAGNRPYLQGC